jgi:glycosyltransferase involved in cell wall biosynthesis
MSDGAYKRVLNQVDIGLQLSFTESFNQVSAEHLARSIPVLASSLVPAMASVPRADRHRLIVDSPEDSNAIRDRLRWLIRHPEARLRLARRASAQLRDLSAKNAAIACRVLKAWTQR